MEEKAAERMSIVSAVLAWLSIGVVETVGEQLRPGPLWWAIYLAYGAAYLFVVLVPFEKVSRRRQVLVTLLAVLPLGVGVILTSRSVGFTAIALVMTAILLGQVIPWRWAVVGILVQTAAVLVGIAVAGGLETLGYAVSMAVAFFVFQLFALLMVLAMRSADAARIEADRSRAETEAANAALRAAQAQLAESSRTQERLRIARDLHDVVGHQLTALSVNLQVAARTATGPSKDDIEVCRVVASELLRDVRGVVSQLRERPLSGPEFAEELRRIGASVPTPVVHIDVADDLPALDPAGADVVRRCVQEVVTNAARHSGAQSVWIAVEELGGVVSVTARDDGRGTSEGVVAGHGLTGMVERFDAFGGSVAWSSRPGHGFSLQASLPIDVPGPRTDGR